MKKLKSAIALTRIKIYVQPRASKTTIAGLHGGHLKVRLAAPPVDGAANEALIEFIASRIGVAKRQIRIVAGLTSRKKVIEIDGAAADTIAVALSPEAMQKD